MSFQGLIGKPSGRGNINNKETEQRITVLVKNLEIFLLPDLKKNLHGVAIVINLGEAR